jgi:RNA polymerase sigma-70 factor (ECF subfamily)
MMPSSAEIWEAFSRPLRGYLLRRVSDPMDAEDILQDVFVKLHTRIDTLQDENRLAPWLYGIARNAVIDFYRTHRAEADLPDDLSGDGEPQEEDLLPRLAQGLRPMLGCLPEKYAQAVQWVDLDGLTQEQMAARAGLSLSGAKSRVQRGRKLLRNSLLDCCHFEFDRRGHPIDYTPRPDCCKNCKN